MAQYKVIRVYRLDAVDDDDAVMQLQHWLTTLHGRETLDVRLVFEKAAPAEEKDGAIKALAKTARDQVLGLKEPKRYAA